MLPPPPIQGIGNAGGFTMQVAAARRQSPTSASCRRSPARWSATRRRQSGLQRVQSSFRSDGAAVRRRGRPREERRRWASRLTRCSRRCRPIWARAMSTSSTSSAAPSRSTCRPTRNSACRPRDIQILLVRNSKGDMVPLGTVATITPSVGPSLISLYNLYPSATVIGLPAQGSQLGPGDGADGADRGADAAAGHRAMNGRRCRIRRRRSAIRSTIVFALALLLVYLVLAGQYESWFAPISVILAVPLSLVGPMLVLTALADRQQSLYPDRPHAADRAVGEERDPDRRGRARASCARRQAADRIRDLTRRARGSGRS